MTSLIFFLSEILAITIFVGLVVLLFSQSAQLEYYF